MTFVWTSSADLEWMMCLSSFLKLMESNPVGRAPLYRKSSYSQWSEWSGQINLLFWSTVSFLFFENPYSFSLVFFFFFLFKRTTYAYCSCSSMDYCTYGYFEWPELNPFFTSYDQREKSQVFSIKLFTFLQNEFFLLTWTKFLFRDFCFPFKLLFFVSL